MLQICKWFGIISPNQCNLANNLADVSDLCPTTLQHAFHSDTPTSHPWIRIQACMYELYVHIRELTYICMYTYTTLASTVCTYVNMYIRMYTHIQVSYSTWTAPQGNTRESLTLKCIRLNPSPSGPLMRSMFTIMLDHSPATS